mgnify:CR=1 FL=1
MDYSNNWKKLESIWRVKVTEDIKNKILEIGEQKFWSNYYIQQQFAKENGGLDFSKK